MFIDLFRAVSSDELADLIECGRLRASSSSCEGKHLACSLADARKWGEALYGPDPFAVLRVRVSESNLADFFRWDRLDGIGPAYFATIEQLANVQVIEVMHESRS